MALRSDSTHYEKRLIDLYFPPDKVCCALCGLMETYSRKQCRRTGEYIVDDRTTGYWCPLMTKDGKRVNYYCEEENLKHEKD